MRNLGPYGTAIVDALKLGVAVGLFLWLDPWLGQLFTNVPIVGHIVTVIVGSLISLGLFALIMPFCVIRVNFADYATRATIAGPQIELPCSENSVAVARYDIDVSCTPLGLVGRGILGGYIKRGARLDIDIAGSLLIPHVRNGNGTDSDTGLSIPLQGSVPKSGTWTWSSVSFDTASLPGDSNAELTARFVVDGAKVWPRVFVLPSSTIRKMHVVRKV